MKHYLLTLRLDNEWAMHTYAIANDQATVAAVAELMLDQADTARLLMTELGDPGLPRSIARENPDARRAMDLADDTHYTAWLMSSQDPRHDQLMELHR